MRSIVLSIHPKYVEQILLGTKKYEYRTRICSKSVNKIYIYETSPNPTNKVWEWLHNHGWCQNGIKK